MSEKLSPNEFENQGIPPDKVIQIFDLKALKASQADNEEVEENTLSDETPKAENLEGRKALYVNPDQSLERYGLRPVVSYSGLGRYRVPSSSRG